MVTVRCFHNHYDDRHLEPWDDIRLKHNSLSNRYPLLLLRWEKAGRKSRSLTKEKRKETERDLQLR